MLRKLSFRIIVRWKRMGTLCAMQETVHRLSQGAKKAIQRLGSRSRQPELHQSWSSAKLITIIMKNHHLN